MRKWLHTGVALICFFGSSVAHSQGREKHKASGDNGDGFTVASSTNIDFNEVSIDGKMQAPQGFFLQGRQPQSLTQMVKLRANFRGEMRNSRSAVKSLVK